MLAAIPEEAVFSTVARARRWPPNCAQSGMQPTIVVSPARQNLRSNKPLCWLTGALLVLIIPPHAPGADTSSQPNGSPSLAFARYIASVEKRDPLKRSITGPILIEASLPALFKEGAVAGICLPDEQGRPTYQLMYAAGDGTVLTEVIGRYFGLEEQMDKIPASTIAITPENYKFRFSGHVNTGGTTAYIYRITPKRKQTGLLAGHLWMDAATGTEIILTGRSTKVRSIGGPVDLVRDTKLLNGSIYARVTHVTFTLPNLGRAQLVITEYPLRRGEDIPDHESACADPGSCQRQQPISAPPSGPL